jgi:hypothetical protein
MGCVSGDVTSSFDHAGGAMRDALCQLYGTVEAMNAARERVAGILVSTCGGPHLASRDVAFASLSLQAGERLAHVEAERGVEGERAIVKGRLDQPYSRDATVAGAIHYGLHKQTANPSVLRCRVNCDGSNAANDGALVEAVAADNPAVNLCHNIYRDEFVRYLS